MPETGIYALTPTQRAQLRVLWNAGATTADTAREAWSLPGFHTTLAALLIRMELIAVRRASNAAPGRFYLTPAGVAEARKPSEARNG